MKKRSGILSFLWLLGLMAVASASCNAQSSAEPSSGPAVDIPIRLQDDGDTDRSGIVLAIIESKRIADLILLLDEALVMDEPLLIRFGAEDGPLYDPNSNEIWIADDFVVEVADRFSAESGSDDSQLLELVEDALLHTLVHEIGHALVAMYDLPVLGREEDAVDSLATLLLIEFYDHGRDIALTAADLFALESEDAVEFDESDFWDEHSLDAQRFYSTLCHIYGSAPEEYEAVMLTDIDERGEPDTQRAARCVEEFEKLRSDWFRVLQPYLQP